MEQTHEDIEEPSRKRKRNEEEEEKEIVVDEKKTNQNILHVEPSTSIDVLKVTETTGQKRKNLDNSESFLSKRPKKFFYLSQSMTKPRKLKKCDYTPIQSEPKVLTRHNENVSELQKQTFTKIGNNGKVCLMHKSYLKYDLFFIDEQKYNYEYSKKQDLSFNIVDEIALEGLDGITVEAFWKRLKNVFPNSINKKMADRLWRTICSNKRINICILEEPREKLITIDHSKYMDFSLGIFVEPFIEFKDIYPICSIKGTDDVRGSCSTYETRKENNGIKKFSMDKALKMFGHKLVFVADQMLRNKALINEETDPNVEIIDIEYCLLERVGRSREQGEITQGKLALGLKNDSKWSHHNRKAMAENLLIVNQFFYLKSYTAQQNLSGGIVHLTRFYRKRKTKRVVTMEQIANFLRDKPNHMALISDIRKIFPLDKSFIRLLKSPEFRRFFKLMVFPYRHIYPNATRVEYMSKNGVTERHVRVLCMIDPCANVTAILEEKNVKESFNELSFKRPGHKLHNYEFLRDVFLYILSQGKSGVTITEIQDYYQMDFYSIRMAVNKLRMRRVIDSERVDMGRQHSQKFFATVLTIPSIKLVTEPKEYNLTEEITEQALKGYKDIDIDKSRFYNKSEIISEPEPSQAHFTIYIDSLTCSVFLTGIDLKNCEELTIYDIVIKGRDRLLLNHSNLIFDEYENEWENYLLKMESTFKTIDLFQSGIGKLIYGYLTSIQVNFEADNKIIFPQNMITSNTRAHVDPPTIKTINILANGDCFYGNYSDIDKISKMYVFEAMFYENHVSNHVNFYLKEIFNRIMIIKGKKKRIQTDSSKVEKKIAFEVTDNVVMKKYMGPHPVLLHTDLLDDGIKIDYYSSTPPKKINNSKIFITDDINLSAKYINRANIILNLLNDNEIVKDFTPFNKAVRGKEGEEGYEITVCRKSVITILTKLVEEGYIKIIKVVLTATEKLSLSSKIQVFVALPYIAFDHIMIRSTIEQLKMRFHSAPLNKTIKVTKKKQSPFSCADVQESIMELKEMTVHKIDNSYKFNKNIGKYYGYCPKFVRMRVLHEFLFYLIREAEPQTLLKNQQILELCKSLKVKVTADEIEKMPAVYLNEISWKMFIPPLPASANPKGWALAVDIILRMPLSVFVKLFNITYEMPDLETYLHHPIKRHFLLKYLPVTIRNVLLHKRKYFNSIYDSFIHLCYVGLVQLGARHFKEKDQVFVYLNSKASLYDTCCSQPGYNTVEDRTYNKISFDFQSSSVVDLYWSEMLRICLNTPLGKRKIMDGSSVIIEDCHSKPILIKALEARQFQEAVEKDQGEIPGDKKGAGGFDASLWTYVKRNWFWKLSGKKRGKIYELQAIVTGLKDEKMDEKNKFQPPTMSYGQLMLKREQDRKILKPVTKQPKKQHIKNPKVVGKRKKYKRTIVARTRQKRREYYDAVDKKIMLTVQHTRVEWDKEEDQLLRLCRVASIFLCPSSKKQSIPYNVIRDVIHRIYPKSKNKTSRAIQRRIYSFLIHDERLKIMESNVENLMNFPELSKYLEKVCNRFKYDLKLADKQIFVCFVYIVGFMVKHRSETELHLLGNMASADYFSDQYIKQFEQVLKSVADNFDSAIYANPKTLDDICMDTIKSVMHCSVACKKTSPGWAVQLYHIYKKFPDEMIRTAVAEMKANHLLVLNKKYEDKNMVNNWHLPLKFSYVYNLMKNTTYNQDMCLESYKKFFDKLMCHFKLEPTGNEFLLLSELALLEYMATYHFEIPEKGVLLNPDIEDHSDVIDELAKRFRFYLVKIFEMKSGIKNKSKDLAELEDSSENSKGTDADIDKIKTQVRNLIFRVPYLLDNNLEDLFKNMLNCSSITEINNVIYLMIVELKKCANTENCTEEQRVFIETIDEGNGNQAMLLKNLSKLVFAIQTVQMKNLDEVDSEDMKTIEEKFQLFELNELNGLEQVEEKPRRFKRHHTNGMEECVKRASEGDFPSLEEIKEGMMVEMDDENRKIPHITDLIMFLAEDRFPELECDKEIIDKMKEHFVIEYPKLEMYSIDDQDVFLENKFIKDLFNSENVVNVCYKQLVSCEQPDENLIKKFSDGNENSNEVLNFIEALLDFIRLKQEFGASVEEIREFVGIQTIEVDVVKVLNYLCDINVIRRVGVTSLFFVHSSYVSKWLVETFTFNSEEKQLFETKEKQELKKIKTIIEERLKSSTPLKAEIKPWSKLDGTLNQPLFIEWLCTILSHCLDYPNIPFLNICQHFSYMKPVDLYYLLEILEKLRCIEIYFYEESETSLFSSRNVVESARATFINPLEDMYIKTTSLPILSFGFYVDETLKYQ